MRSSNILVLVWALSCSAATLPACGTSCVARAFKKTGCAPNDSPCICNSEHYSGYLQYCFSKKCSSGDKADALRSATEICHIASNDGDSKSSPADELKKRDAQWGSWGGNGDNNWRSSSNQPPANNNPPKPPANNNPPKPPANNNPPKPPGKDNPSPNNPPGKPPGQGNWPPAPTTTKPPKHPNPPAPHTTTKPSKHTTEPWKEHTTRPWKDHTTTPWNDHTTKTKPTKTWHTTKEPPHTTKTHSWYTSTINPTVLGGWLPGLKIGV